MLVNMIFNALDAMPDGGDLTLTIRHDAAQPDLVTLEVKDTGTGMTEEVRKRCLEPFFTTKGSKGTGLGLAMSYGIVKRHHGDISIHSRVGHGTRIVITIPQVAMLAITPPIQRTTPSTPMRILVVDDDEMVRTLVSEFLTIDGHAVTLAEGPEQGLKLISTGHYDLVITDKAMPEMSGEQLALEAKRLDPDLPILMLTGFGEFMNAAGEQPEGIAAVISKPVTMEALRAAVARVTPVALG